MHSSGSELTCHFCGDTSSSPGYFRWVDGGPLSPAYLRCHGCHPDIGYTDSIHIIDGDPNRPAMFTHGHLGRCHHWHYTADDARLCARKRALVGDSAVRLFVFLPRWGASREPYASELHPAA